MRTCTRQSCAAFPTWSHLPRRYLRGVDQQQILCALYKRIITHPLGSTAHSYTHAQAHAKHYIPSPSRVKRSLVTSLPFGKFSKLSFKMYWQLKKRISLFISNVVRQNSINFITIWRLPRSRIEGCQVLSIESQDHTKKMKKVLFLGKNRTHLFSLRKFKANLDDQGILVGFLRLWCVQINYHTFKRSS